MSGPCEPTPAPAWPDPRLLELLLDDPEATRKYLERGPIEPPADSPCRTCGQPARGWTRDGVPECAECRYQARILEPCNGVSWFDANNREHHEECGNKAGYGDNWDWCESCWDAQVQRGR